MRRVLLAAVMIALSVSAQAADMPDYLRGSVGGYTPVTNWQGFYFGGQGAWASSTSTFSGSTMDHSVFANLIYGNPIGQIPGITAPTPFGTSSKASTAYGAFLGYNWQWDDVVAGLEMSYLHGNMGSGVSAASQFASSGRLSDGLFHDPLVTSTSAVSISDYATFRGRAGYAFGCFLPYAFGGFALGYSDTTTTVKITDFVSDGTSSGVFPPISATHAGENHLTYGYTGGLGVDVKLMSGLFMRAEWEYVRFTQQVDTNINSLRLGLGYKF